MKHWLLPLSCLLFIYVQPTHNINSNQPSISVLDIGMEECLIPASAWEDSNQVRPRGDQFKTVLANGLNVRAYLIPVATFTITGTAVFNTLIYAYDVASNMKVTHMAANVLTQISTVSSYLGPIGYSIGFIVYLTAFMANLPLDAQVITSKMQVALDDISWRFGMLEDRIERIEHLVQRTILFDSYKRNQDKIRDVMVKYHAFARTPNPITMLEFREVCQLKDPTFPLAWIHRRLVYEDIGGGQLMDTILRDVAYDRRKLRAWIDTIMKDVLEGIFLREACLGVKFGGEMGENTWSRVGSDGNQSVPIQLDKICAFQQSRNEADKILQDVGHELDKTETKLMEEYGSSGSVSNDMKKMIAEYSHRENICNLTKKVENFFNKKYPWVNWWVAVFKKDSNKDPKKDIQFYSVGGHFAKEIVHRNDGEDFWLVAVYSEKDTVIPEVEGLNYHRDIPQFWQMNQDRFIQDKWNIMQDNLVKVIIGPDAEYQCDQTAPEFSYNFNLTTEERKSAAGLSVKRFFYYYKTKTLANTYQCKEMTEILEKKNINRIKQCSALAFNRVIKNILQYYSNQTGLSTIFNVMYTEFDWTILAGQYFMFNNFITNCDQSTSCTITKYGETNLPILAIWTSRCANLTSYQSTLTTIFKLTQKYLQSQLFHQNSTLDEIYQYFKDPYQNLKNYELSQDEVEIVRVYNMGKKIIFLSECNNTKPEENVPMKCDIITDGTGKNGQQMNFDIGQAEEGRRVIVRVDFYEEYENAGECLAA